MHPSGSICQACHAALSVSRKSVLTSALARRQLPRAGGASLHRTFLTNARPNLRSPIFLQPPKRTTQCRPQPRTLAQLRFASSTPTSFIAPSQAPAPDFTPPTSEMLSDPADQFSELLARGDGLETWFPGYLKEMGLEFGYGPTSIMQWLLEHVHIMTGGSISTSIIITALVVRLCVLPLIRVSSDQAARLQAAQSIMKPFMDRMKIASASRDAMEMQKIQYELGEMKRAMGLKMSRIMWPFVQIPLGFGIWRLLRNMADLHIPGMTTGGMLWFQDLTRNDPYYILPFVCAAFQHFSLRTGGESAAYTEQSKKIRAFAIYVLPALTPLFISFAPSAVQLTFTVASIFAFFTGALFRSAKARKLLRMAPLMTKVKGGKAVPYGGTINVDARVRNYSGFGGAEATPRAPSAGAKKGSTLDMFKTSKIKSTLREKFKSVMPDTKGKVEEKRQKQFESEAKKYELKRQKQIKDERQDWERTR